MVHEQRCMYIVLCCLFNQSLAHFLSQCLNILGVLPLQLLNPVFLSPGLNKPGVFTFCALTTGFQVNRFGDRWRFHGYHGYMRSRSDSQRR
jgi:hypothetical protein